MQAVPELRPLGVGDIVDRVFTLYRSRLGALLVVAAVPYLVFAVAAGGLGAAMGPSLASVIAVSTRLQGRTSIPPSELSALLATFGQLVPYAILIVLIAVAFTLVQSAALVRITASAYLGQSVTVGDALRAGLGAFPRLLLMGLAALVVFAGLWAVGVVGLVVAAGAFAAAGAAVVAVLLALVLVLALVIATIYLQASWMVSPAVTILENTGPIQSLGRAWHLSSGSRWRILGLQFLLSILQIVLSSILSVVLVAATGSDPSVQFALQQGVNLVASIAWAPIYWGTFAVLYYDLRVRKEAFDLQLAAEALPRDI